MHLTDRYGMFCYPIYGKHDAKELLASMHELFGRLGPDAFETFMSVIKLKGVNTLNLTHLPGLEGSDRWLKFNGNHVRTVKEGANEKEFTEVLEEAKDLAIGRLMQSIFKKHEFTFKEPFVGRCQLIWSGPGFSYPMHTDDHTKHRYHIPLFTDPGFMYMFKQNEDYQLLHMPADGRTWYLNPRDVMHTVVHVGHEPRAHLLLTA